MNEYKGYDVVKDRKTPNCFLIRWNNKRPISPILRGFFNKINEAKKAIDRYENQKSRRKVRKGHANKAESVSTV
jgi:hypothetical protein